MQTLRTACHLSMSDEAVLAALPVFFFLAPSSPTPTGALSAGRFLSALELSYHTAWTTRQAYLTLPEGCRAAMFSFDTLTRAVEDARLACSCPVQESCS